MGCEFERLHRFSFIIRHLFNWRLGFTFFFFCLLFVVFFTSFENDRNYLKSFFTSCSSLNLGLLNETLSLN
jgi:hypothetical protein